MEKKNIDWSSLGFGYHQTEKRYVTNYKDGAWDAGVITEDANIVLNECAGVLQYAQTCFEGLKAYTTEDGQYFINEGLLFRSGNLHEADPTQIKDKEITKLVARLKEKDTEIVKLEKTVNNLSNLYNEVYYKQSDLRRERNKYEKRFIAISETLMCILPELGAEVKEDIEKDFMSKILDRIADKEREWW